MNCLNIICGHEDGVISLVSTPLSRWAHLLQFYCVQTCTHLLTSGKGSSNSRFLLAFFLLSFNPLTLQWFLFFLENIFSAKINHISLGCDFRLWQTMFLWKEIEQGSKKLTLRTTWERFGDQNWILKGPLANRRARFQSSSDIGFPLPLNGRFFSKILQNGSKSLPKGTRQNNLSRLCGDGCYACHRRKRTGVGDGVYSNNGRSSSSAGCALASACELVVADW